MVNVRFYGSLKQFGTEFNLDCKTPAEVVHALTSQIPKLRQFIQQGLFTVRVGREYLDSRYLEQGLSQKLKDDATVHFTPTLKGSKRGGVFGVIAGAAIVAGALALGPLGLGVLGSTSAMMIGGLGASMLLGGVAQMLTKMPTMRGVTPTGAIKPESTKSKQEEKKQSTSFSNLSNMVAQGKSMPLAYGLIRTGTLVISQGVETMDVDREPTVSTSEDTNKLTASDTVNTGNTGSTGNSGTGNAGLKRHRDKNGKIYPWIAARRGGNG